MTHINRKSTEFSCFEVLDVLDHQTLDPDPGSGSEKMLDPDPQ
jgi:hypothetical protein